MESLAECAKGTLRRKKAELTQALQARITEHQRFMLRAFMEDLEFVERKIARIEETIRARMAPHEEVINRLNTIPGVNQLTASTLIAELGVQMQQFPDAMHLASWAGLCPGDCESAGKRKNTRTRKGNPHVRRVLCQAAWARSSHQTRSGTHAPGMGDTLSDHAAPEAKSAIAVWTFARKLCTSAGDS